MQNTERLNAAFIRPNKERIYYFHLSWSSPCILNHKKRGCEKSIAQNKEGPRVKNKPKVLLLC